VLEAMAAVVKAGAVKWDQVLSTLDTIVQRTESVERAQQQLAEQ
jgi:cytochrome c-type biogenesis protein CcmH/NrfG